MPYMYMIHCEIMIYDVGSDVADIDIQVTTSDHSTVSGSYIYTYTAKNFALFYHQIYLV